MKILNWLVVLCLLISSSVAYAAKPVIGAGISYASTKHDGFWYQEALPHTLKTVLFQQGLIQTLLFQTDSSKED